MKNKLLRLPDDLAKIIEDHGLEPEYGSESNYMLKAIRHFSQCNEQPKQETRMVEDAQAPMRMIVTQYPGHCLKCGHDIASGSWALYGKGVGLICLDCFVLKIGDKALIAKYLKTRELRQIIAALQVEADRLAEKVENYNVIEKQEAILEQQEKLTKLAMDFLTHKIGTPQEKEALEEILRQNEKGKQLINDIETFITQYVKLRKKPFKKRFEKEEEAR